jgi:hypothetical protein
LHPVSAERHWDALDAVFSRLLSPASAAHGHQRLARRAAALTGIYLPRIVHLLRQLSADGRDPARQQRQLERTHRALSAALSAKNDRSDSC